jgi:uncharacterized protein (DUF433 family)
MDQTQTPNLQEELLKALLNGTTKTALAKEYGVSRSKIQYLVRRKAIPPDILERMTDYALARGLSPSRIQRVLRLTDEQTRKLPPIQPPEWNTLEERNRLIAGAYREGESVGVLAEAFHLSKNTIYTIARSEGTRRKGWG